MAREVPGDHILPISLYKLGKSERDLFYQENNKLLAMQIQENWIMLELN